MAAARRIRVGWGFGVIRIFRIIWIIRVFRIFRIFRIFRVIRTIRTIRGLRFFRFIRNFRTFRSFRSFRVVWLVVATRGEAHVQTHDQRQTDQHCQLLSHQFYRFFGLLWMTPEVTIGVHSSLAKIGKIAGRAKYISMKKRRCYQNIVVNTR